MIRKNISTNSVILAVLLMLLLMVHLKIWDSSAGFLHLFDLRKATDNQAQLNAKIKQENEKMASKIASIKAKPEILERSARENLGMISKNEKFFQFANKS